MGKASDIGRSMFCTGQLVVNQNYEDGMTRVKEGHPDMSLTAWNMINNWVQEGNYSAAILFFTEKCEFTPDYAGFLIREFFRGYVDKPENGEEFDA